MKKIVFTFIFITSVLFSRSQIVNMQWAKSIGGVSDEISKCVTKNIGGNVYTIGHFQGIVDFDPGPGTYTLTSNGSYDIFISALDFSGNFLFAKNFGGTGNDNGLSIKADATSIYATGFFMGTADFDPDISVFNLTSAGDEDIFVLKLDLAGNLIWAKSMGGIVGDISNAIDVDASGNVYTTGVFQGTSDFDPGVGAVNLNGSANGDIFISKLNSSGGFVWAKNTSGSVGDLGNSITVDATGNVYSTGYYSGTVDFDPGAPVVNLTSNGNQDVYILKLDAAGVFVWAKSIGGASNDYGNSLALDALGNVCITGGYDGMVDLDPGVGTSNSTSVAGIDVFILKLNSSGNFVWAKTIGDVGFDMAYSIATDAGNNIYTTGTFAGTTDFDPGVGTFTAASQGAQDVFILKVDDLGNFLWTKTFGGTANDISNSIAVNNADYVFTTGNFNSTVDFDPNVGVLNFTSAGGKDVFIHKLNQCFVPVTPVNITSINNQFICYGNTSTLAAVSAHFVDWYATPTSTISLGNGTTFVTPVLTPGTYTYYAEASSCTVSLTRTIFTITVNTNPTVTAVSNMTFICSGESATLSASGADSYTWSSGGNAVSEIVSPTVTTNYTVTGFDVNNCYTSIVVSQSVNACIGIEELSLTNSQINIYPNPTNGILNFELETLNEKASVQITNVTGQVLISETIDRKNFSLNISDLKSGIYFVELKQGGIRKTMKVVKE